MATNIQLYERRTDSALLKRLEVAVARHAAYIANLGAEATQAQAAWLVRARDPAVGCATITQRMAWEAVMNTIIADAADPAGIPDTGSGSIQTVVDAICEAH
jgi:hypothetical protein